MHKDGKWAKQIIALQESDGKWGCFHSLSQSYNSTITTEQALRRLERLGYTIEDDCIQKAVSYMNDCLVGKNVIPDRKEKVHDWNVFTSMILATWIRRFTLDNPNANKVAKQWSEVISSAFASGAYNHKEYILAYQDILGTHEKDGRIIDFVNFYSISLLWDCMDRQTEYAVIDYILNNEEGIYYIYDNKISALPQSFKSKEASRYLAAIELLSKYQYAKYKLEFVVNWLNNNRNENNKWDMGKEVNDKVYFPLSDDWREKEVREADCTQRIERLLENIKCS